jgi:trimeric autotransporter adhesin
MSSTPRWICATGFVMAAALLSAVSQAQTVRSNVPARHWVTDGDVLAVAATSSAVYIGGDFTLIGPPTGAWVGVTAAGRVGPIRGTVDGVVSASVADGHGGWFLLGEFNAVGGTEIEDAEVIHLGANGRLDLRWSLTTDGTVETLALHGDTLYVGGSFTKLKGTARTSLGAVNARTGALLE